MENTVKISIFSILLMVFLAHTCVVDNEINGIEQVKSEGKPTEKMPLKDKNEFEKNSEITRNVLITHCGRCHQSSLETHKKDAIAVFDLDQNADWHQTLAEHNLEGITNRIQDKNSITEEQKLAITAFLENKSAQLKQ
ncbi:MAG: hypothetical protein HKN00_10165 [Flavobacteriaceae bacterium]|nr:hypothetical protein [Bacteroidia bacterium]NNF75540.1 hypothetical protein [Flavobacteriaceae bacterium]